MKNLLVLILPLISVTASAQSRLSDPYNFVGANVVWNVCNEKNECYTEAETVQSINSLDRHASATQHFEAFYCVEIKSKKNSYKIELPSGVLGIVGPPDSWRYFGEYLLDPKENYRNCTKEILPEDGRGFGVIETLTVPAGTFLTCHKSWTSDDGVKGEAWFAAEPRLLGMVKLVLKSPEGKIESLELKNYKNP